MARSHMHLGSKQSEFVTMIIKHTFTGSLAEREAAAKMSLTRAVTYNGKRAARLPDLALETS